MGEGGVEQQQQQQQKDNVHTYVGIRIPFDRAVMLVISSFGFMPIHLLILSFHARDCGQRAEGGNGGTGEVGGRWAGISVHHH